MKYFPAEVQISPFAEDVLHGLRQTPKRIPPKYFYDDEGSRIFRQIMQLPEYYPTRCEYEILEQNKAAILRSVADSGRAFDLIELGAGDGLKTKVLLRHFLAQSVPFSYVPVDISAQALRELCDGIRQELPGLHLQPMEDEYFAALENLRQDASTRKVILFLGSNIGNFTKAEALDFLNRLRGKMNSGDWLLVGFDLKKHPAVILNAYNDASGVTKAFNINLLRRINRELDADFDLSRFGHYPLYHPETGEARSYLVSQARQSVRIGGLDATFAFAEGEVIHTEISRKYTVAEMEKLARNAGFQVAGTFTDRKNYFADVLLEV